MNIKPRSRERGFLYVAIERYRQEWTLYGGKPY